MKSKGTGIASGLVAIILLFLVVYAIFNNDYGDKEKTSASSEVCQSCGKTFYDEPNMDSIRWKNMCKKCYDNFEWAMKASGKWD